MKFTRPLPSTLPKALTYADGNFAIEPFRASPARIQGVLVDAQWIVLVLALVLFVLAGPRPGVIGVDRNSACVRGRRRAAVRFVSVANYPRYAA